MEIKIAIEELRQRKLFVATPCYGGMTHAMYTDCLSKLTAMAGVYQLPLTTFFLHNESLIQRARNYCVDQFLRSDCDHLLFIDADIGFDPNDALVLLALQSNDSPYDVICAPYPKKNISWEKIKLAVDRGAADKNPNDLEDFVGDFVFNPVIENGQVAAEIRIDAPSEVSEAGTGFMMIRRKTFETYRQNTPHLSYKPDHVRTKDFNGDREIHAYFDCMIDPETKRYLSEDYFFCYNVRKMGMKVWMCPWIRLAHAGSYIFKGNLHSIASIGASPTIDEDTKKYFK